jgi:hypothetical protein
MDSGKPTTFFIATLIPILIGWLMAKGSGWNVGFCKTENAGQQYYADST